MYLASLWGLDALEPIDLSDVISLIVYAGFDVIIINRRWKMHLHRKLGFHLDNLSIV